MYKFLFLLSDDDSSIASPVLQIVDGHISPQIIPEATACKSAFNKIKKGKGNCMNEKLILKMKGILN